MRKPHLKATNNQQGMDVVDTEILHNGFQVGFGQRPVVRDTSAWIGGIRLKASVHLISGRCVVQPFPKPEISHRGASQ